MLTPPGLAGTRLVAAGLTLFALLVPLTIAGANMAWAVALVGVLLNARSGARLPLEARRSSLEQPLWIYLGVAALTSAFGVDPLRSLGFFHQEVHKVWLYTLFAVAFALAPSAPVLASFAGGFALAAVIGIAQVAHDWIMGIPVWARPFVHRAHAFVHPATYGEQMCLGLLGACAVWLSPTRERPRWTAQAAAALAALLGVALLLSGSRASVLAFAAGLTSMLMSSPLGRRWARVVLLAGLVGTVAIDLLSRRSLFSEARRWATGEQLTRQFLRLNLWSVAWRMGLDHPWTGVGHNNFRAEFPRYFSGRVEGEEFTWGTAHNVLLHHFAERGLVGVAALLLVLAAYWLRAWRRARRRQDTWSLWGLGSATGFLVMNLTEVAWQTEIIWMLALFVWVRAEAGARSSTAGSP